MHGIKASPKYLRAVKGVQEEAGCY